MMNSCVILKHCKIKDLGGFFIAEITHLTKTLKQATTSLKIPLLRLQPCSLPLRHGKGNVAFERDGMNSPLESLEFKVTERAGRLLLGLTAHSGAITTLHLTQLHMQISLSNM